MSILDPNILKVASYSDEYLKMIQQYQSHYPHSMPEIHIRRPVSETKAVTTLIQIVREMPDTVGADNVLQDVDGRRCITGELLYRLGLLDAARYQGDSVIPGSAGTVLQLLGGAYSDDFRTLLISIVHDNDMHMPWGEIGKRYGLAA